MMKSTMLTTMVLTMFFSLSSFATVVVGKVNIQEVISNIKVGKKINGELKKVYDKKKSELQSEEKKLRDEQQKFQKQAAVLSDKARAKMQEDFQQKVLQLQQKTVQYQKEIQELEKKKKGPILQKLKEIVSSVSKSSKVSMTFEISSAPIVYAEKEVDLTAKVIEAFDKKYPKL